MGRLPCDGVEGLSERTVDQLGHLGVDAATVRDLAPAHRTGTWGSERRPVDGVEWLVDRSTLAEAVRSRAIALGARFVPGMVTDSVPDGELWRHRLIDGTELEARVVVDARGRRGPEVDGPRLVAIGQRRRFSAPQGERGTAIRPFQSGWAWWAWRHDELWVQITTEPRSGPVSARLREQRWLPQPYRLSPPVMTSSWRVVLWRNDALRHICAACVPPASYTARTAASVASGPPPVRLKQR